MSDQFSYTTYGASVNATSVRTLLEHALDTMLQQPELPVPVCIWGRHGIGKTELVRDLAQERGYQFAYIAPAQFEEMGDLLGMPQIGKADSSQDVTRFVPPDWVPRQEGPGILLIDDVNRADDRILRGIMQLLQFYEMVAWKLPPQWLIVLTANPDGGDYSVTPLDEAMLTRMLHVTMEFEVKAWARWAERAGVDSRGINFVLAYPELITGHRTTPRSLVQFFQSIQPIADLNTALPLVRMLGDACLDKATTQAFINFVHLRLDALPSPEEMLWTDDFPALESRLRRQLSEGDTIRLDILSVLVTRMSNYLKQREKPISEEAFGNLQQFIMMDLLPNDLRLSMAQDLTATSKPWLRKLYGIPQIGKLLLEKM
ncbi:MAG: AAA family ATPase [Lewinellaceae bacterium]|nr:AAA family ATPase [Lewinellaceae bacterium]